MKRATFGLISYTMAGDTDFSDLETEFRKLDKEGRRKPWMVKLQGNFIGSY